MRWKIIDRPHTQNISCYTRYSHSKKQKSQNSIEKLSSTHALNCIVLRVNPGLISCEEFAIALQQTHKCYCVSIPFTVNPATCKASTTVGITGRVAHISFAILGHTCVHVGFKQILEYVFGEYLNIQIFSYNYEYLNIHFKGNVIITSLCRIFDRILYQ